jgi:hypothetical protein
MEQEELCLPAEEMRKRRANCSARLGSGTKFSPQLRGLSMVGDGALPVEQGEILLDLPHGELMVDLAVTVG